MVFLVGDNKKKQKKIRHVLEKSNIRCKEIPWNEINIEEDGLYLFISPPQNNKAFSLFNRLLKRENIIITLFNNHRKGIPENNHYLNLPRDTNAYILKAIVKWSLSQKIHTSRLKSANEQLNLRKQEIVTELTLASELQKSLLPKELPKDLPINFVHRYLPHTYIGGDFFDIIRIDQEHVGIIIADVSGHGVSAAFITAMFKSVFNHYAFSEYSPSSLLNKMNQEFVNNIKGHYITGFYAIIDTGRMKCTYCNAGHPRQLIFHRNGDIRELGSPGFFIGMFETTEFEDRIIDVYPGDRLFFFTDGIIEVIDADNLQFGKKNLIRLIREGKEEDIVNLSNKIITHVMMYMKENFFPDDITVLIAELMEDI
ncbi:MAG: PP2C family protein-serine/threonine phosphatase [Spirochaetales bacterium]|nr:PP2C family protein-serine/threonine phosphatase [Spirochaetales bacterium]